MTKKEKVLVEEGSRQVPEEYHIKITPDNPYPIYGNPPTDQEIIPSNEEGSSWVYQRGLSFDSPATPVTLRRCRYSRHGPFCDGSHKRATDWDSSEANNKRPLFGEAEGLEGFVMVLTDNEKYCTSACLCDTRGRVWNLVQLAETEEERELIRRETTHCPVGRLVVWNKETQKVFEPPLEPSIGIIEDPGIRASGPVWIKGSIRIGSADGKSYAIRNRMILCRCGQSPNKPFCDGMHASMGFSNGPPPEEEVRSGDPAF